VRLVAVVVSHNRRTQLETTVRRLLAEPCDRVIVVDNVSTDGSRDWLAAEGDPRLVALLPEENLGGAGGFAAGMQLAVERYDPDWMVVMDDDARPEPGAIAAFLGADHPGADAVAAAVYYPDGRICEMNRPSLNPFWHPGVFLKTLLGGGRMGFHIPDRDYQGPERRIEVASFVGLFLARATVARAGFPEAALFLYGDDSIYTLGLSRAGMAIRFAPDIRFQHDCSTFAGAARVYRPIWKVYYNYRNGLILYRRAAGWLFWPALLVILPKWALNGLRYGTGRRQFYRLLWCAVRDGILDRRNTIIDR